MSYLIPKEIQEMIIDYSHILEKLSWKLTCVENFKSLHISIVDFYCVGSLSIHRHTYDWLFGYFEKLMKVLINETDTERYDILSFEIYTSDRCPKCLGVFDTVKLRVIGVVVLIVMLEDICSKCDLKVYDDYVCSSICRCDICKRVSSRKDIGVVYYREYKSMYCSRHYNDEISLMIPSTGRCPYVFVSKATKDLSNTCQFLVNGEVVNYRLIE